MSAAFSQIVFKKSISIDSISGYELQIYIIEIFDQLCLVWMVLFLMLDWDEVETKQPVNAVSFG